MNSSRELYIVGVMRREKIADAVIPAARERARGDQREDPLPLSKSIGNDANTVVMTVISIGRSRL